MDNGMKRQLRPRSRAVYVTALVCVLLILGSSHSVSSLSENEDIGLLASKDTLRIAPDDKCPPYRRVNYLFPASVAQKPSLYVYKSKRRLLVLEDDILIRDYPIALGFAPVGNKRMRGDGRTPEGEFFVCLKNPNSKYDKALLLSYPGQEHAREAFLSGLLSYGEYRTIIEAHENREPPPQETFLGGDICIHGGGAHKDWTEGCVALYNFDMNELFEIVTTGTPVFILP